MIETISEEDIQKIRRFEEIMNKGLYVSGGELQDVYNRVMQVSMTATNCGSCLRQRTKTLVDALNNYERKHPKQTEEIAPNVAKKKKTLQNK